MLKNTSVKKWEKMEQNGINFIILLRKISEYE